MLCNCEPVVFGGGSASPAGTEAIELGDPLDRGGVSSPRELTSFDVVFSAAASVDGERARPSRGYRVWAADWTPAGT